MDDRFHFPHRQRRHDQQDGQSIASLLAKNNKFKYSPQQQQRTSSLLNQRHRHRQYEQEKRSNQHDKNSVSK